MSVLTMLILFFGFCIILWYLFSKKTKNAYNSGYYEDDRAYIPKRDNNLLETAAAVAGGVIAGELIADAIEDMIERDTEEDTEDIMDNDDDSDAINEDIGDFTDFEGF